MPSPSQLILLVIHYAQRDARLRFALRLSRDAQLRFNLIVARDALLRVQLRKARDARLRVSLAIRHEAQLRARVAVARDARLRLMLSPARSALLRLNVGASSVHEALLLLRSAAAHDGVLLLRVGAPRDAQLRIRVRQSGTVTDPQLEDLAQQTITFEPWVGATSYGDAVYGDPVVLNCRIEGRVRMIRSVEGIEMVSTTTIYLIGYDQPHVSPRDRITLPTPPFESPEPRTPPILAVWNTPDETGRTYYQEIATP
jgi:hypothetical protein